MENNEKKSLEVLDVIRQKYLEDTLTRKLNLATLCAFSKHLTNSLSKDLNQTIHFENYYKLGGYEFEIALIKKTGETLLLDINGKIIHQGYEDYIFDIDRCQIAQKSNHKYYRLWLSNFYNNPSFEMNKIKTLFDS